MYSTIWVELVAYGLLGISVVLSVKIALREIKRGMEAQKRFISSASHELKTPLSILKANSELALMDSETISKKELLEVIESNIEEVNRMNEVIVLLLHAEENFVDTTRKTILTKEIDLSNLIYEVASSSIKYANDKRINMDIRLRKSLFVIGNISKLRGIIYGVLHNAITYTPEDGHISVSLVYGDDKGSAKLIVKDNGVGIPDEDLPHIFDPFYRTKHVEKIGHRGDGGGHFGLGLTTVKRAVQDHGGSINIISSLDNGTEVRITLPIIAEKSKRQEGEEVSYKIHST